jgi:hypothetical protein
MDRDEMSINRTRLSDFSSRALEGSTSAVSLHAHTHHSSENMGCVPAYLDRIPLVAGLFRYETRAYLERNGTVVDFSKGWWHPPLTPHEVLKSETAQIVERLHLEPFVSITDHDNIDAGLELQSGPAPRRVPISLEWTVPADEGFLHLGVHNLQPAAARALFAALSAYTAAPDPVRLPALLEQLTADPDLLIVLNHPLWDLADVGMAAHVVLLHRFLRDHRGRVHALELNGYRPSHENDDVCALAETAQLPLISGGDRHGRAPNCLLNLTRAKSFADFVHQIREDRQSDILIMPEYRKPLVTRGLAVAADVIRPSRSDAGAQRWMDRVTCECKGTVEPLSAHWPEGGPLWVRSSIQAFRGLTSPLMLPLLGLMLTAFQGYSSVPTTPADANAASARSASELAASASELADKVDG